MLEAMVAELQGVAPLNIAVVGATGAVGTELLSILEKRRFPAAEIRLFASQRSKGKKLWFAGRETPCRVLDSGCFDGMQIVFFDASDEVSAGWVPAAAAAGAWVVDNSATFRLREDVPLIVPEVNARVLEKWFAENSADRIVSGPNCSTAQLVMALKPISDRWGLRRVVVSTYQSTSGAGKLAMQELVAQTGAHAAGKTIKPSVFPHQIAYNCIPRIGGLKEGGCTGEEQKMVQESRKLLGLAQLRITATAVRVPTLRCHGESVNIECERAFELDDVRRALGDFPGICLIDDLSQDLYPMGEPGASSAVDGAAGRDRVYVGRVRRDDSTDNGLNLWVVSDNLRKGAALNAVQIGEIIVQKVLRC